jgi:hypothetical protein
MKRFACSLLLAIGTMLLSGCGAGPLHPALLPSSTREQSLLLNISPSRYQSQAVAHRWQTSDICQYEVVLKIKKGNSFVEVPPRLIVQQSHSFLSRVRFEHLKQGNRYQVAVFAKGNPGGTEPQFTLNSQMPCTVDFGFAGEQDVEDILESNAVVTLDAVAFSGKLTIDPERPPGWTKKYAIALNDADSGKTLFSDEYDSQHEHMKIVLGNLRHDVRYRIVLTALNKSGNRSASWEETFIFSPVSAGSPDIEQDQTLIAFPEKE